MLQELLHQTDQVLLIERSGAVGAGVEETPHLLVVLQGIENQLLFDDVLVEQFLVERANRALQRVGDAKVFGGDQFPSGRKRHLEDTAAHVDLHQVELVLLKGVGGVSRRIEFDLHARQQPVDRTYEIRTDGVEVRGRRPAEGRNIPGAAQKALVFLGKGVDTLGQPLQAGVPNESLVCDACHYTSLAATARFPQFPRLNQVQKVNLQTE